jgi:hypothetical protein
MCREFYYVYGGHDEEHTNAFLFAFSSYFQFIYRSPPKVEHGVFRKQNQRKLRSDI